MNNYRLVSHLTILECAVASWRCMVSGRILIVLTHVSLVSGPLFEHKLLWCMTWGGFLNRGSSSLLLILSLSEAFDIIDHSIHLDHQSDLGLNRPVSVPFTLFWQILEVLLQDSFSCLWPMGSYRGQFCLPCLQTSTWNAGSGFVVLLPTYDDTQLCLTVPS